jgi:hypothetical protein
MTIVLSRADPAGISAVTLALLFGLFNLIAGAWMLVQGIELRRTSNTLHPAARERPRPEPGHARPPAWFTVTARGPACGPPPPASSVAHTLMVCTPNPDSGTSAAQRHDHSQPLPAQARGLPGPAHLLIDEGQHGAGRA